MPGVNAYQAGPGITQISRRDSSPESKLPEGETAPPIDGAVPLQLPLVLFQPSLDQALTSALQPSVRDRSILQPDRFQALVESTQERLAEIREELVDERQRQTLAEAEEVLGQTSELREALRSLRALVHRA